MPRGAVFEGGWSFCQLLPRRLWRLLPLRQRVISEPSGDREERLQHAPKPLLLPLVVPRVFSWDGRPLLDLRQKRLRTAACAFLTLALPGLYWYRTQ